MLTLGGELDDGTLRAIADLDALRERPTAHEELGEAIARGAKMFADLAVCDLESAHGRAARLGVVDRRDAVARRDRSRERQLLLCGHARVIARPLATKRTGIPAHLAP